MYYSLFLQFAKIVKIESTKKKVNCFLALYTSIYVLLNNVRQLNHTHLGN